MANFTDWMENAVGNHFLRGIATPSPASVYLALFSAVVNGETGNYTEVVGGSYERKLITFAAPTTPGYFLNDTAITFFSMPDTQIVGFGIFTALVGGDYLYYKTFAAQTVSAGDSYYVGANIIEIRHQ